MKKVLLILVLIAAAVIFSAPAQAGPTYGFSRITNKSLSE